MSFSLDFNALNQQISSLYQEIGVKVFALLFSK
jgi:hypothetical protein